MASNSSALKRERSFLSSLDIDLDNIFVDWSGKDLFDKVMNNNCFQTGGTGSMGRFQTETKHPGADVEQGSVHLMKKPRTAPGGQDRYMMDIDSKKSVSHFNNGQDNDRYGAEESSTYR